MDQATRLRIYVGEDARWEHQPLYEAIVLKARAEGLAGAIVLRGPMGYGPHSEIRTAKVLRLSENLPMIVEIVDAPDKIGVFLQKLQGMVTEGMATLDEVQMVRFFKA